MEYFLTTTGDISKLSTFEKSEVGMVGIRWKFLNRRKVRKPVKNCHNCEHSKEISEFFIFSLQYAPNKMEVNWVIRSSYHVSRPELRD